MAHFIWNIGNGGKPAITFSIDPKGGITAHHNGRGSSMYFGTDVSLSQLVAAQRKRAAGGLIQSTHAFLDEDRREFLVSGMTPEMWDEMMAFMPR
jgi:hypothetical protein